MQHLPLPIMNAKIKPIPNEVDILENDIVALSPAILKALLKDHTRSTAEETHFILWATNDYAEQKGEGYGFDDEIKPDLITGDNGYVITPRISKHLDIQTARSKDKAEVFTPSWLCNEQNNLIDDAWFGRKHVFNVTFHEGDQHTWEPTTKKIKFPKGKTWRDYVRDNRMEITCGEAPYLVSRYDTTTGNAIPVSHRIGLLDRKLRVVNENTKTKTEWTRAAKVALMSCYGFEWQGDSLFIARENVLWTIIDYHKAKFDRMPTPRELETFAYYISWNLWQMDGLKGVIPNSCHDKTIKYKTTFGEEITQVSKCSGCVEGNIRAHNGIYCLIRNWNKSFIRPGMGKKIRFIDNVKL